MTLPFPDAAKVAPSHHERVAPRTLAIPRYMEQVY